MDILYTARDSRTKKKKAEKTVSCISNLQAKYEISYSSLINSRVQKGSGASKETRNTMDNKNIG